MPIANGRARCSNWVIKRLRAPADKLIPIILTAFALASGSCAPRVTKGSVYQEVSKCARIGADKSEVIRCVDSVVVNGVKPKRYEYARDTSGFPVVAPDGKEVQVDGTIYASFRNNIGSMFCNYVGVIFYFDGSGKLITYHIDCFG